jgi:hypothetical protein
MTAATGQVTPDLGSMRKWTASAGRFPASYQSAACVASAGDEPQATQSWRPVSAALAAAVGGLLGGRRDPRDEFGPRADDAARDFERAAPRPLGGRPPATPPADDDGIEIT